MKRLQNLQFYIKFFNVSIVTAANLLAVNSAFAQITPDATLPNNSNVNLSGNIRTISGGTQAGGNLFHSFSEFSVPNNTEAFFNNAVDINNIITRVTGGSISNIDGLIKANGQANLFLMNPNGIIFGQGARLDIGGSFIGTSASSINFADGFSFSATATDTKPLLTISAPIGLGMGINPGEIKVQGLGSGINNYAQIREAGSRADGGLPIESNVSGLSVKPGKTLGLLGGNVSVEGGVIRASEGQIDIGSVGSNARVSLLGENWKLGYEGVTNFGDILFSSQAFANAANGGGISLRGGDINLNSGSILVADTLGTRNAGEINIIGNSVTFNQALAGNNTFNSGNAGKINISANNSITFENQGGVGNSTSGLGNAGEINLKADSIIVRNNQSGVGSLSYKNAQGQAGKIKIETSSFTAENAGVATTSFGSGKAGEIDINVTESFKLSGRGAGITSWTAGSAQQGGLIKINANSVIIEDNSGVNADAIGGSTGNAGEIYINADNFTASRGFGISSETKGSGNGGLVRIAAKNTLTIENGGLNTGTNGKGNAGEINLTAGELFVRNFGINSSTSGEGNGGIVNIKAGSLTIENGVINLETSGAGKAGEINIQADKFTIKGAGINSKTTSSGDGGLIKIKADDLSIIYPGLNSSTESTGNAGKIEINARHFKLGANLKTSADRNSQGRAGNIDIKVVENFIVTNGSTLESITSSSSPGGIININANNLLIENGGKVNTNAESGSTGNAGEINITVPGSFTLKNAGAINSITKGSGIGGRIQIDAKSLFVNFGNINSNTEGVGKAGEIKINVLEDFLIKNNAEIGSRSIKNASGNSGIISIRANNLLLQGDTDKNNNVAITTRTESGSSGQAGEISIKVNNTLELRNRGGIDAITNGTGNAGNITVEARNIILEKKAGMRVTSEEGGTGNAGNLNLIADSILLDESQIIGTSNSGNGGNLTFNIAKLLELRNNSRISTTAGTQQTPSGNGGDITINIPNGFIVAFPGGNSDIAANAYGGSGGKINIRTLDIFGMQVLSRDDLILKLGTNEPQKLNSGDLNSNDITAFSQTSPNLDGQVNINTPDVDPSRAIVEFPANLNDSSNLIATACNPDSPQNQSSFVSTGRSGLPANPTEALQDSSILQSWVRVPQGEAVSGKVREISESQPPLVEATGWLVDANGKVHLVANAQQGNSQVNKQVPRFCPLPRG